MITIQETNKKHIIRALKRSPNYYIDFRKRYYISDNYKFFYNALFKSFNPRLSLGIMYRNNMIQIPIFTIINENIVSLPHIKLCNIFKNCFDVTFRVESKKDKQKLYDFCIKYGIIPDNRSSNLEKFIDRCHYFYITEHMILGIDIFPNKYITLCDFINRFENSSNKANNIKVNFFKRLIEKLKIKYSLL